MKNNPFFLPLDEYRRNFDLVGSYKRAAAKNLSIKRNIPYEKALTFIESRELKVKSPALKMFRRKPGQDRSEQRGDLMSYLKWIEENGHILTPNLITYCNPKIYESFISGFIDHNLQTRGKVKKDGQIAKQNGDSDYSNFCDLLQSNYKIRNNSLSGATSSPHNPMYYGSAHTSLTSTCRTITSTANSINEKMLASNRHYFTPLVTKENILYIVTHIDMIMIHQAVCHYNLNIPTVDEAFEMTLSNTRKYWESEKHEQEIYELLKGLDSYELAAYVMAGDLRQLTKVNDCFMRGFYNSILTPSLETIYDPEAIFEAADGDIIALAGMVGNAEMKGKELKKVKAEEPELYLRHAGRVKNIMDTFEKYRLFIEAFITTTLMPGHLHDLPSMLRDSVVASDTDSSIFSTKHQIVWFTGTDRPTEHSMAVGGITTYMASQNIAHSLGTLCAQIGVPSDQLFRCTMKNEFYFSCMVVTTRTKHYMALIDACEGQVFNESDVEIKGVNLKNSKLPPSIRKVLKDYQEELMKAVRDNTTVTPFNVIAPIGFIEHHILSDIRSGGATFYRYEQAKTKETYARPESSNYQKICLWNDVFGSKYGHAEQLPAQCVKIPVTLKNKEAIKEYAEKLPGNMGVELLEHSRLWGKTNYTNMLIPVDMLIDDKIPEELRAIVDERKILRTMTDAFYITAECYGMYAMNKNNTKFYSDMYTEEQCKQGLFFPTEI